MKIRTGFVSNSSSSSFIVAYKGNKSEARKEITKAFVLPKNYPIKNLEVISEKIYNRIEKELKTDEDIEYYFGEDYIERFNELKKEGFKIFVGSVSTDEDEIENFLCSIDIEYNTEQLKIFSEDNISQL
jgi:hypothetical protein